MEEIPLAMVHGPVSTDLDLTGTIHLDLARPTFNGRTSLTLTAGAIDDDARELFGNAECHRLAAAIGCLTGRSVVTVEIPRDHAVRLLPDSFGNVTGREWCSVHSAVLTPAGTVLDIFGERDRDTVTDLYRDAFGCPVRIRTLRAADMPGDVIVNLPLNRDAWWWTRDLPDAGRGAFLHFARLLINGTGHVVPPQSQPAPPTTDITTHQPAPAPPSRHNTTTPTPGGSTMSSVDEMRARLAATNEMANQARAALSQADMSIEEIHNQLAQVAASSSQTSVHHAMGAYTQARELVEQLTGLINLAASSVDEYAGHL